MRAARVGAWLLLGLACLDVIGRQISRLGLGDWIGGSAWPLAWSLLIAAAAAVTLLASSARRPRAVALFVVLLTIGSALQMQLGARLQSDGFYYYAFARSIWFDRDVDLTNDYRLLGLDDAQHRHLFTPTVTGHAQTTWAIGPALLWSPFLAAGHVTAVIRHRADPNIAVDGTSFPYRQAVCLAGLFYGLLGLFVCYRICRTVFASALSTSAVVGVAAGSFVLWYLIREPSMSHAVSMCAVAVVVMTWLRVGASTSAFAWTALGLAGGVMMAVRWQNALVMVLPAATLVWRWVHASPVDRRQLLRLAAACGAAVVVGFLPQMLAWQAIYGRPLAQSPIAPTMFWTNPKVVDLLWSSRNGLFATSPAIYLAAIGLLALWRRDRRLSAAGLFVFAAMAWTNGAVDDWYGGAGYGGRRFDSVVPFFVCGLAAAVAWSIELVRRRPAAAATALLAVLVVWNITLMAVARAGVYRLGQPVSFGDLGAAQTSIVHDWIGHPPSYPANLVYAVRNGVAPARFDLLSPGRFLGDPSRPYGRIDIGSADAVYLADGWHGAERADDTTFRWATREAMVLVPLDRVADLTMQIRLLPFSYANAPPQRLRVFIGGAAVDANGTALADGWQVVELAAPAPLWRRGVNRVRLTFDRETRPVDVGGGGDARPLAAAVDYVRVVVR
jgi:hypothetical protein